MSAGLVAESRSLSIKVDLVPCLKGRDFKLVVRLFFKLLHLIQISFNVQIVCSKNESAVDQKMFVRLKFLFIIF